MKSKNMYSPRIKEKYIPYLYKEAKALNIPMTDIVNDVIEDYLLKVKCRNCLKEIILDVPSETAYCNYCDSEVFVIKGGRNESHNKR